MRTESNVFYLPPIAQPAPIPAPTRWSVLRARAARRWWRFRIIASEIRGILARPGRRTFETEYPGLLEAAAALEQRARRPLIPARVIDLDAARIRRRASSAE